VKNTPIALYTFLSAAQALASTNQLVEAEIKYGEALRMANREFGAESDQVVLVMSILAAFYRATGRAQEALPLEQNLTEWTMRATPAEPTGDTKFVGGRRTHENLIPPNLEEGIRIPNNLRHACQILGIPMEDRLTATSVNQAWKKQMLVANAHPDLGGNPEEAILLNNAKIEIMSFLESCKPKLGAHFKKD
jgi:hypothetical protein